MTNVSDTKDKLTQLATAMNDAGVCAFIQPINDEFQGEYTPEYAQRLTWMSGFTGSAGTAVFLAKPVGGKQAVLFVDGRYTLQAEQEVDTSLFEVVHLAEQSLSAWFKANADTVNVIGYDAWLHTQSQVRIWQQMADGSGQKLQPLATNLIDGLWHDQPAPPTAAVELHDERFSGEPTNKKCRRIGKAIADKGADAALLALPDGINWLLNIRGSDIPFNPLYLSFAMIAGDGTVKLFSHAPERVPAIDNVTTHTTDELRNEMGHFKRLLIDPSVTAAWFFDCCAELGVSVVEAADPTLLPKACKNETEMAGMRKAHIRDGQALTAFLSWLKQEAVKRDVSEMEAVEKLEDCRKEGGGNLYRGQSFATISGAGPNGAIVHYRVSESSDRVIGKNDMYLVDSGGQYLDGTTDVTRTIINGTPTAEMIDRYTRVLKGHIAVASAQFPQGTTGSQLDTLARQFLWEIGCDYEHGTGHGVGSYLCVHEGPQRISKRGGDVALMPGMILSNEPGYYKDGEYGIRIENLVLVIEIGKTEKGKPLLGFETLTLAPFEEALIDNDLLTSQELAWLASYERQLTDSKIAV